MKCWDVSSADILELSHNENMLFHPRSNERFEGSILLTFWWRLTPWVSMTGGKLFSEVNPQNFKLENVQWKGTEHFSSSRCSFFLALVSLFNLINHLFLMGWALEELWMPNGFITARSIFISTNSNCNCIPTVR